MRTKLTILLCIFTCLTFFSCSTDNGTNTPNPNPNTGDQSETTEIVAEDYIITGTLKSRDYSEPGNPKFGIWKNGKGKIIATLGDELNVAEGVVEANGQFTITLPGKMKASRLVKFYPLMGGSIVANPNNFLTTLVHLIFQFDADDNDPSKTKFVYPRILKDNITPIRSFGYIYTGTDASLSGVSATGMIKYNSKYKKGWNLEAWQEINNITEYSVISELPQDAVWY